MAFVIVFTPCVCACVCVPLHACQHKRRGHDLLGAIVTLLPVGSSQMPCPVTPFSVGRALASGQLVADKLGLEVTPGASGFPGESWSSAEAQVSLHKVFLVLGSRLTSKRYKLVVCFRQIKGGVICFSLTQLLFILNGKRQIRIDDFNFFLSSLDIYTM